MARNPRRVGVLGGTFDPIHIGHLVAAVNARHELRLDVVLLVVANVPWQKAGHRAVTPAADRLAMVQAAVDGVHGLEASDLEIRRGGPSYTADTLDELAAADADVELFVIVGTDVADDLGTWERVEDIRRRARLVVVTRPGASPAPLPGWQSQVLVIPALEISSTDLRRRVAEGRPLDYLIPGGALRCIRDRGLYAGG